MKVKEYKALESSRFYGFTPGNIYKGWFDDPEDEKYGILCLNTNRGLPTKQYIRGLKGLNLFDCYTNPDENYDENDYSESDL